MSFRCELCGVGQDPGVAPIQVVTKIRNKGNSFEWKGTDIVEEKNVCATCHDPEFVAEVLGAGPPLDGVANSTLVERT